MSRQRAVPGPFTLAAGGPPIFQPNVRPTVSWWQQYAYGLQGNYGWPSRITATGLAELDSSTNTILGKVPPVGASAQWQSCPQPYVHKSVVAGSVQSGKTRSMIGLAAKAFDNGFRIVVVLSGLKNDLRQQTSRRFNSDLLQNGEAILDPNNVLLGHTHPRGLGIQGSRGDFYALPSDYDAHEVVTLALDIRLHLQQNHSILLVIKKNRAALRSVRNALAVMWASNLFPKEPLFVIDDECDEASVPGRANAPTPQQIEDLWRARPANTPVAYIGYTATLQANIFQNSNNALYPQAATVLRSPSDTSTPVSYYESGHPNGWYTGSDVFYEWLQTLSLRNYLVRDQVVLLQEINADPAWNWQGSELQQALIAYFVSGAVRLLVAQAKLGQSPYRAPPHSMLVHTHGGQAEHMQMALAVCSLCNSRGVNAAWYMNQGPRGRIDPVSMNAWLTRAMPAWRAWYDDFRDCYNDLQTLYSRQFRSWGFPSWVDVENELRTHVFANVQLKIVNSDTPADTIDFTKYTIQGQPRQPEDEFTIVVGGNILSRGITIDGLTISYFTRRPQDPVDDTTCQRQRWFGYRGQHVEFCRLFTTPVVLSELRRAGHSDIEALNHLASITASGITDFKSYYLRGYGAGPRPTSRPGAGSQPSLNYTGTWPANTFVHTSAAPPNAACPIASHNRAVAFNLANQLKTSGTPLLRSGGAVAGYLRGGVTAIDAADLLDSLLYSDHNPRPDSPLCQRFTALETVYGITGVTLHRMPHQLSAPTDRAISEEHDPYLIAAYLRAWHYIYAALQSNSKMINRAFALDRNGVRQWTPIPPPKFNVVFRLGRGSPLAGSPFGALSCDLPERGFVSPTQVNALWGGSSTARDEWIDQPTHPCANPVRPRPAGVDGLLMLYVVHPGRHADSSCEFPAYAINVPLGGPCFRATACR